MLRKVIPHSVKLYYQLCKRYLQFRFFCDWDTKLQKTALLKEQFSITLEIKRTRSYDNKVHNLQLAANELTTIVLAPDQVFSFWKNIPAPSARNGYKKGRNIVNNKLIEDYGGGLCQLSGLIYYLAIKADLEILERHNHSRDIYDEASRFTPLGTDATVVYGYKDLIFRNNKKFDIQLDIKVLPLKIIGTVRASQPLPEAEFSFDIQQYQNKKIVTITDQEQQVVNVSRYIYEEQA